MLVLDGFVPGSSRPSFSRFAVLASFVLCCGYRVPLPFLVACVLHTGGGPSDGRPAPWLGVALALGAAGGALSVSVADVV